MEGAVGRSVAVVETPRRLLAGPFEVEYAAGASRRDEEYRLRYRIFVEEREWLSGSPSDGLERDAFDPASCSFILRDSGTGAVAACQRLILPDRLPPDLVTAVQRFAPDLGLDLRTWPLDSWAEVSRSSIAAHYRWGAAGAAAMPAMRAIQYASI